MEKFNTQRESGGEDFESQIQRAREALEGRRISLSTVEKIRKTARRFSFYMLTTVGALAGTIGVNHALTRYHISSEKGPSGTEYKHQDPETTAMIDYLTGKAPLPEELRVYPERKILRDTLAQINSAGIEVPMPEHIETMSRSEIREVLTKVRADIGLLSGAEDIDRLLKVGDKSSQFNQDIYETIWELQEKVGAPKIRFADGQIDMTAFAMQQLAGVGRAFYDSFSNTVYLDPSSELDTLLSEDSHALQFDTDPYGSRIQGALGVLSALSDSVTNSRNLTESYQQQYTTKGSLEEVAHKDIEQRLKKEASDSFEQKQSVRKNNTEG